MKTHKQIMKRLEKNNRRQQLKTKNRMKWIFNVIYRDIRLHKGLKEKHLSENNILRKIGVLANKIYIRSHI